VTAILSYLEDGAVFEPDALRAISRAFDETCNELHIFAGDEHGRQVIATRVIDLARMGIIDASALRDRVLLEARTAA
jgi:hypothetical protein